MHRQGCPGSSSAMSTPPSASAASSSQIHFFRMSSLPVGFCAAYFASFATPVAMAASRTAFATESWARWS